MHSERRPRLVNTSCAAPCRSGPERDSPQSIPPQSQAVKSPRPGARSSGPCSAGGMVHCRRREMARLAVEPALAPAGGLSDRNRGVAGVTACIGVPANLPSTPPAPRGAFAGSRKEPAETALAGQQVMFAAFVHDPEDTTEPVTPCPYLPLAFRMRPLSPFTGPDWDPPTIYCPEGEYCARWTIADSPPASGLVPGRLGSGACGPRHRTLVSASSALAPA